MVLWVHCTIPKEATREMPFSLVLRTEAIIPTEIGLPSYRVENNSEQKNNVALLKNLDFIEERREQAAIRLAAQKNLVAKYYNSRVRPRSFLPRDLVLRKVF